MVRDRERDGWKERERQAGRERERGIEGEREREGLREREREGLREREREVAARSLDIKQIQARLPLAIKCPSLTPVCL